MTCQEPGIPVSLLPEQPGWQLLPRGQSLPSGCLLPGGICLQLVLGGFSPILELSLATHCQGSSLRSGAILGAASALSQAAFSDLRGTTSVSLLWNAVSHFFPKSFPFF